MPSTISATKRPANDSPPACLLCGSTEAHVVDQFRYRDLRRLYFKTCQLDIDLCIEEPYVEEFVRLRRCSRCDLEFYSPRLQGNVRLYEALAKFDYYYGAEKWEFSAALRDVAGADRLLEVGCGNGAFLRNIIASPFNVIAESFST